MNSMENSLRIYRLKIIAKACYTFLHHFLHGGKFRQLGSGKNNENMQLQFRRHGLVERVLIQPPCFAQQAQHAVAVYRFSKLLFGHGKAGLYRRSPGIARNGTVDEPYREKRKRFPFPEKRINMLLALQPLVCF